MTSLIDLARDYPGTIISLKISDLLEFHNKVIDDAKKLMEEEIQARKADEDLTIKEAAKELNVSTGTLYRWQSSGYFKCNRRNGKALIYKRSQIENFKNGKH